MAGNHGGARPGAGRKPNAERHADAINRFSDLAANGLGQVYDNLCTLADGGWEQTDTRVVPAGLIFRKDVARHPGGKVIRDKNRKPVIVQVRVYPDLPADQLVTVEIKRRTIAPDFRANEYLANRVMGVPRQAPEDEQEQLDMERVHDLLEAKMAAYRNQPAALPAPPAEDVADESRDDEL